MPYLKLWFYDPTGDRDGYLNHFVARLDGPYCHCELQFPDNNACTIYMGTNVVLKKRSFSPEAYTCVNVSCTPQQLAKARRFAEREFQNGTSFSTMAMSMALIPLLSMSGNGTFCSKLCADILVAGEILEGGISTHKMSPSALFRITSQTMPGRMNVGRSTATVTPIGFK